MGPDGKGEGKRMIEKMEERRNGRKWVFDYLGGLLVKLAVELMLL